MSTDHKRGADLSRVRLATATAGLLLALAMPGVVFAQTADTDLSFQPRFAVGGGASANKAVCFDCDEPGVTGFSGGFEYRLNEDWSVIVEGLWTEKYLVYGFQQGGVDYPSLMHNYFVFANVKFRWEFTDLAHPPYLVVGGAARFHKDTYFNYGYRETGMWWERDVRDVTAVASNYTHGAALFGFGWAFKIGDRVEIRPEVDFYLGQFAYENAAVTAWFNF